MSETIRDNYNLRPRPDHILLPVQIQLSDAALMSHITQDSQPTPGQGQGRAEEASDNDSIDSNLLDGSDPDGQLEHPESDNEQDIPVNQGAGTSGHGNVQDLINQRILDQLQVIGSRLEKLEQSNQTVKKTADKSKTEPVKVQVLVVQNKNVWHM